MTFTVKTFTALPERSLALTTVSYHGCLEAVHPSPVIYKTHMHKGKEVWIISSFPATLRKPCSTGFVGRFFFFNYSCLHCLSLPVGCVDLLTLRLSEKKPLMFCYQGAPSPKGSDLPAPWWAVTTLACGMLIIFNCCCVSSHIRLHQMTEWDVTDRRQSSVIPANPTPPPPPSPEPFAFTVWIYQPSVKSFQRIKAALMVWPQWRHQLPVISKSPVQQELRA